MYQSLRVQLLVLCCVIPFVYTCDPTEDVTTYTTQKCFYSDNVCETSSQSLCQSQYPGIVACVDGCNSTSVEFEFDTENAELAAINNVCANISEPLEACLPISGGYVYVNCSNSTDFFEEEAEGTNVVSFAIGTVLAFIGSTGESLGFTFMKLAHDREHRRANRLNRKEKFYLCNREWWMAMGVFTAGNILDFIAFGMTGQTIVILVGCWALCVNLITAPIILGEKRMWMDWVSIAIILVGIALAVGGSSHTDRKWTSDQLLERYADTGSAILLAVVLIIIIISYIVTRLYHRNHPMDAHAAYELELLNRAESKEKQMEELNEEDFVPPLPPPYIRVCHVLLAAMTAVATVCSAKASSEMLIQSFDPCLGGQFNGLGIIIIFVFVLSIVFQLHFIQTSLMVNDALFHIPVFYVFWQIGSTVSGGVLYLEFEGLQWYSFLLFAIGVCFLLIGIKLASGRLAAVELAMAEGPSSGEKDEKDDFSASSHGKVAPTDIITNIENTDLDHSELAIVEGTTTAVDTNEACRDPTDADHRDISPPPSPQRIFQC